MLAIRIDEEIEKKLDMLAKVRGTNRSAVVREAILQYLEDNEDLELAKEAEIQMKGSKPLKQLGKELGLLRMINTFTLYSIYLCSHPFSLRSLCGRLNS